jgi:hypothetical protein
MKAKGLIAGIFVLAGIVYGASYLISRRAAWSSQRSMVMLDYTWIATTNGLAETLFAIHQPLVAIDKLFSGQQHFTILESGTPPVSPTLVTPSDKVSPAP